MYVQCSPLGPRVTETVFASTSTPSRMDALPLLENLMSLYFAHFRKHLIEIIDNEPSIHVVDTNS